MGFRLLPGVLFLCKKTHTFYAILRQLIFDTGCTTLQGEEHQLLAFTKGKNKVVIL